MFQLFHAVGIVIIIIIVFNTYMNYDNECVIMFIAI